MKYKPISCDYYDELTILTMRHTVCPIVFKKEDGTETLINMAIKDVFTRSGEEFLLLSNGEEIRLDYLVSADGKVVPMSC